MDLLIDTDLHDVTQQMPDIQPHGIYIYSVKTTTEVTENRSHTARSCCSIHCRQQQDNISSQKATQSYYRSSVSLRSATGILVPAAAAAAAVLTDSTLSDVLTYNTI